MQKSGWLVVLFCLIQLCLFQTPATAQSKKVFVITGKIVPEIATSADGTIEITKTGAETTKIDVPRNGRFRIELEYFNEFTLTFILPGHFSKTIIVSTDIPQEVWKRDNDFPPFPMIVQLFKEIEGIDKSFTLKASGRIFYGKQTDNFEKESIFNDVQIAEQITAAAKQAVEVKKEVHTIKKQDDQDIIAKQKNFDQLITEADILFKRGEYQAALLKYQQAQKLFPEKAYPNDRIAELQDLVKALEITEKQKAELELKYKNAMASANGFFDQKTYSKARKGYDEALAIKPGDAVAKGRIEEIDQLLALLEKQQQFDVLIAKADKSFDKKDYINSQADYRKALTFKADETYPANRIKEIDQILEKEQQAKVLDDRYNSVIANADKSFQSESYTDARKGYTEALTIKPNETYPTGQITKIDDLIAERARLKQVETEFQALVIKGDAAFNLKEYEDAKTQYTSALDIKPNSAEVVAKIKNIDNILQKLAEDKKKEEDRILALAAAKEKGYTDAIALADKSFDKKYYVNSQADYRKALTFKADETYPANRIKEIDQILEKEQQAKVLDDRYNSVIANADKSFQSESYTDARKSYTEALTIKPGETYPTGQITKIDDLIAEKARLKQIETEFQALVVKGDAAFNLKEYDAAKTQYTSALGIKPNSAEVAAKIKNIDNILQKLAEDKKKEEDRILAVAAAKEKGYTDAIALADKSFDKKDYINSQADYRKALTFKADETYPANRIKEIDQILEKEQQAKVLDDSYNSVIANADKSFQSESYTDARKSYTEALTIKPGETYPTGQITKIDDLIAERARLKQVETEFQALVVKGDAAFNLKEYDAAKTQYTSALDIKPNSAEVAAKIKNIDSILQKLAEDKKKEEDRILALAAAKEKGYTDAIALADKSFDKKDYVNSQSDYRKALTFKAEETYPANRIKEIDQILEKEQQAKILDDRYNSVIANADKSFQSEGYTNARKSYTEALTIKPNETYPTGQITKIDDLIAEKARLKQIETEFQALVIKGDAAFNLKEYDAAKTQYTSALDIKPNSAEVAAKIKNIDNILQQIAADNKKKDEQDRLLALSAANDKTYNETITKGNKQIEQKTYSDARATFQEAKKLKPSEQLPDQMIAKIDALITGNERELAARQKEEANQKSRQEAQDISFNEAMTKADKAFTEKDFNTAKTNYQTALTIKGTDSIAKEKLAMTEAKLAELAKLTQDYNTAINVANKHVGDKQYKEAKDKYQEALQYLPDSDYPKRQIEKLDELLLQASSERQKEELYASAVKEAEAMFLIKDYSGARATFVKASGIKPSEPLPVRRIKEIDKLLADLALEDAKNKTIESNYMETIKRADQAFTNKEYSSARLNYSEAVAIKPNEQYPKSKIAEIDKLLVDLKIQQYNNEETNRLYTESVKTAQEAFRQNKLKEARDAYQKAHDFKPSEPMPPLRITELSNMIAQLEQTAKLSALEDAQRLAKEKAIKVKYDDAIATADKAFTAKQYINARLNYSNALALLPNEKYPKDQITKIELLIAQQEKINLIAKQQSMKDSLMKVRDEAFGRALASAKELEQSKQYQSAILKYKEAIELKPIEKTNIQKLIASLEEKIRLDKIPKEVVQPRPLVKAPVYNPVESAQSIEARAQAVQPVINYEMAISKADAAFGIKDYIVSRFYYYKASELKPKEEYPKNQIDLIRKLVDSELSAIDRSGYQQAITQADEAFQKRNYTVAQFFYYKALGIKSYEKYPKDRIQEIMGLTNSLLSEKEEKAYRELIARADEAFIVKDISIARFYYNKAIVIKANEEYPRIKINDIQKLIDQKKQDLVDVDYNKVIDQADKALKSGSLMVARFNYNKALIMRPNDQYPKDQLRLIMEILNKQNK